MNSLSYIQLGWFSLLFFSFCLFFFVCFSPLKELMIINGKLSGGQVFHPKFLMVIGLPSVEIWFHLVNLISIFHISSGYHNDYNSKNNWSCMFCVASFKSLSMFHIFLLIFLCSRQGANLLCLLKSMRQRRLNEYSQIRNFIMNKAEKAWTGNIVFIHQAVQFPGLSVFLVIEEFRSGDANSIFLYF